MNNIGRNISGVILACISLTVPVPAYAQINAEQTLAIGQDLLAEQDYVLAIQYFNKAIKGKPYLPEPFMLRGLAKLMMGDLSGAETDCTRALELNSFKREPYRIRGIARLQQHRDSAGLGDFDKGLEQAPADRSFLYYKGISESRLGLADKSQKTFGALMRIYPDFIPGYTAQAYELLSHGQTEQAASLLDMALKREPYSLPLLTMRAELSLNRGEWHMAASLLTALIDLKADKAELYVDRGVARARSGAAKRAAADFATALDLAPDHKTASDNLSLILNGGDPSHLCLCGLTVPDPTLPLEQQTYALHPTDEIKPMGFFALSFTHPYSEGLPMAYPMPELEGLNRSKALPSGLYLSHTADEMPDAEQAVSLFAYADGLETAGSALDPQRTMGRAVAYAMLKNYESALSDLDRITAQRPELASPLLERAFVRMALADTKRQSRHNHLSGGERAMASAALRREAMAEALADVDAALLIDPELSYAWYDRALILERMERDEEALESYTRALQANPHLAEAYFNRGLLLKNMGREAEAARDMSRAGEEGISRAYTVLSQLGI